MLAKAVFTFKSSVPEPLPAATMPFPALPVAGCVKNDVAGSSRSRPAFQPGRAPASIAEPSERTFGALTSTLPPLPPSAPPVGGDLAASAVSKIIAGLQRDISAGTAGEAFVAPRADLRIRAKIQLIGRHQFDHAVLVADRIGLDQAVLIDDLRLKRDGSGSAMIWPELLTEPDGSLTVALNPRPSARSLTRTSLPE